MFVYGEKKGEEIFSGEFTTARRSDTRVRLLRLNQGKQNQRKENKRTLTGADAPFWCATEGPHRNINEINKIKSLWETSHPG